MTGHCRARWVYLLWKKKEKSLCVYTAHNFQPIIDLHWPQKGDCFGAGKRHMQGLYTSTDIAKLTCFFIFVSPLGWHWFDWSEWSVQPSKFTRDKTHLSNAGKYPDLSRQSVTSTNFLNWSFTFIAYILCRVRNWYLQLRLQLDHRSSCIEV